MHQMERGVDVSDMGMGVGEDARAGAAANGVVDGGCYAAIGIGTCVISGADADVEAMTGAAANGWNGGGSEIKEVTAQLSPGRETWAVGLVEEDENLGKCRFWG